MDQCYLSNVLVHWFYHVMTQIVKNGEGYSEHVVVVVVEVLNARREEQV